MSGAGLPSAMVAERESAASWKATQSSPGQVRRNLVEWADPHACHVLWAAKITAATSGGMRDMEALPRGGTRGREFSCSSAVRLVTRAAKLRRSEAHHATSQFSQRLRLAQAHNNFFRWRCVSQQ